MSRYAHQERWTDAHRAELAAAWSAEGCALLWCRVLELAVRDLHGASPEEAADARAFIEGRGLEDVCESLGLDPGWFRTQLREAQVQHQRPPGRPPVLRPDEREAIRQAYASGGVSHQALAQAYNVSSSAIFYALNGGRTSRRQTKEPICGL